MPVFFFRLLRFSIRNIIGARNQTKTVNEWLFYEFDGFRGSARLARFVGRARAGHAQHRFIANTCNPWGSPARLFLGSASGMQQQASFQEPVVVLCAWLSIAVACALLHLQPSFSSREPAGRTMVSILTRIHELIDAAFFYISQVMYITASPTPAGTLSP
jgi:hypothetical protein